MAAQIVNSGNHLSRTANVVSGASNFTVMFWFVWTAGSSSNQSLWASINGTAGNNSYTKYAAFYNESSTWTQECSDGATVIDIEWFLQVPTEQVWKHFCYVRSGSSNSFFLNGMPVLGNPQTLSLASAGLDATELGDDGRADGNTGLYSNYREWSVALTNAQIQAEMASTASVVHTAGLVAFCPLTSNANDTSGNGNNFSTTGTVTYVADPVFPTHFAPTAPVVIGSLPYTSPTENHGYGGSTVGSLFFRYTPLPADNVISMFPFGALGAFTPFVASYRPDFTNLNFGLPNGALLMPVETGTTGQPYLFEVIPAGSFTTPTEVLQATTFTGVLAPAGSPAIPDTGALADGYNLPLAAVGANSSVLAFINPFPPAGLMNVIGSGASTLYGATVGSAGFNIYGPTFTLMAAVTIPGNIINLGSDGNTTFYVLFGASGHYKVQVVSSSGAMGAVFDLGTTQVKAVGANATNTLLDYYTVTPAILQWNIPSNTLAGTLIASPAGMRGTDMLVLQDSSIVFGDSSGNIVQYSSAGSLIRTYTTPNSQAFENSDRLAVDLTSATFWYYQIPGTQPQHLVQFSTSTGAVLQNIPVNAFTGGAGQQTASATPTLFGPNNTCPLFVTREALAPPTPYQFLGTLQKVTTRRLRRVPFPVAPGNVKQRVARIEIQFQPGAGFTGAPTTPPEFMVRMSFDQGHSWSMERMLSAGQAGSYTTRAFANGWGSGRWPVIEVSTSDPSDWVLTDCFAVVSAGDR